MSGNTSKISERSIVVTTDRSRLDLDVIHGFLARSYWAEGIPRETVARWSDCRSASSSWPRDEMRMLLSSSFSRTTRTSFDRLSTTSFWSAND